MIRKCARLAAMASVAAALLLSGAQAKTYKIDISLETGANHVRNEVMEDWARNLEGASGGRLKLRLFHGAGRFKGADLATALSQGTLDMGAPGHWHLGAIVPEFNLLFLPAFFGASREQIYAVMDGAIGRELNQRIEKKLQVKVIGRHFDLGYATMFTAEVPLTSHAGLVGLKMRVPGGPAILKRYEVFGVRTVKVGWQNVPQALQRHLIDGVLTTYDSVRSARLWEYGLKHALDDNQAFFQYVPMMSTRAWDGLPRDLQALVVSSWEQRVDGMRKTAKERQASARLDAARNGIETREATPEQLKAMRIRLLAVQPAIIEALKLDAGFVKRARAAIDKTM